jgi:hypothetical protein
VGQAANEQRYRTTIQRDAKASACDGLSIGACVSFYDRPNDLLPIVIAFATLEAGHVKDDTYLRGTEYLFRCRHS